MRIFNKSVLYTALSAAFIFSCSSEDPQKSSSKAGSVLVEVDGEAWTSTEAAAVIGNGAITIVGNGENDTHVTVSVLISTEEGTYSVKGEDEGLPPTAVSYYDGSTSEFSSTDFGGGVTVGSIVIKEIDEVNKTISGSFTSKVKHFVPGELEVILEKGTFTKIPYTTESTPDADDTFAAKIGGVAFTPNVIGGTKGFGTLTLNFSLNGTKTIAISVPDNAAPGTYELETIGDDYFATYISGGVTYVSSSGSITISTHNIGTKRITGTFSFTADEFPFGDGSVSVTNGSFGITYY